MPRETFHTPEVHLTRIEPARNAWRFYHAALWPDLFGGVSLAREWGRIGQAGTLRLDPFETVIEARDALHALVRRKQRRGYLEVS